MDKIKEKVKKLVGPDEGGIQELVRKDDVKTIKKILNDYKKKAAKEDDGGAALIETQDKLLTTAVRGGAMTILRYLLEEEKIPADQRDEKAQKTGLTNLMELLVKNSDRKADSNLTFDQITEIATLLLKYGANPNVRLNKKTPLYQVCRPCYKEKEEQVKLQLVPNALPLVKALLEAKADPNAESREVYPLDLLVDAEFEYPDVVEALVLGGADTTKKPYLLTAATKKWAGVCKALLKKADVNQRNAKDETGLHKACASGDSKTILIFLENKADVKAKDMYGNFPHNLLPMENPEDFAEVFTKFTEAGADLNDESTQERSALGLLSKASHKKGTLKVVQFMVEKHGFDPSGGPHVKKAPLINACTNGDIEVIEYLISKGANVNTAVKGIGYMEGVTPLNAAVLSKSFSSPDDKRKALNLLVEKGAKVTEKELEVAKNDPDSKILDILNGKGSD